MLKESALFVIHAGVSFQQILEIYAWFGEL